MLCDAVMPFHTAVIVCYVMHCCYVLSCFITWCNNTIVTILLLCNVRCI